MNNIGFDVSDPWQRLRHERNFILAKSDRHMFWDSPLTETQKLAWAAYRTTLRDLPDNIVDVFDPVWPTPPT